MQKLVTGMPAEIRALSNTGFTLLEILVVVVIIGITVSFALLAFGDFGGSRRILVAAEQFANFVKLAEQEAILSDSTLGIKIDAQGYQMLRFTSETSWQTMSQKSIFHPYHFPTNAVITLQNKNNRENPDIIIEPSGNISPFQLNLGVATKANLVTISGKHNGSISLTKHHE